MIPAVLTEERMDLLQVGEVLGVDPVTVRRWVRTGLPVEHGRVVKLEAVRVGRNWRTSREALGRFLAASQPDAHQPEPVLSPSEAERRAERAKVRLRKMGVPC